MKLAIPEIIETPRLRLQRLRYEDAEEIFYTYASKPEATRFVSWQTHQSIADTRRFLMHAVRGWEQGVDYSFSVRIRENNRMAGGAGFLNDEGKVQLGYIFGPLHWGQGFATETSKAILKILLETPGIYRVGSFVDAENTASVRVLLKAGMEEEARLSQWFRFVNQENHAKDCLVFRLPRTAE
jgi:ribosomal-protein-alanine N-acetyltransferase